MPTHRSNNVYASKYKCEIAVTRKGVNYTYTEPCGSNAYCAIKIPGGEKPIYCCVKHLERARLRGKYPEGTMFTHMLPAEYRMRKDDPPQAVVPETGC